MVFCKDFTLYSRYACPLKPREGPPDPHPDPNPDGLDRDTGTSQGSIEQRESLSEKTQSEG